MKKVSVATLAVIAIMGLSSIADARSRMDYFNEGGGKPQKEAKPPKESTKSEAPTKESLVKEFHERYRQEAAGQNEARLLRRQLEKDVGGPAQEQGIRNQINLRQERLLPGGGGNRPYIN